MSLEFQCTRCGDCCQHVDTATLVNADDLMRWVAERRNDVLDYRDSTGRLWYDPNPKPRGCPFLAFDEDGLAACTIHETKPHRCRNFPDVVVRDRQLVSVDRWAAKKCPGVENLRREVEGNTGDGCGGNTDG